MAKVKCSACGQVKFVNPKAMEARLKKYGSIEEIEKVWKCRECLAVEKVNAKAEKIATKVAKKEKTKEEKKAKKEAIKVIKDEAEGEYEEPTIEVGEELTEEEKENEDFLAR